MVDVVRKRVLHCGQVGRRTALVFVAGGTDFTDCSIAVSSFGVGYGECVAAASAAKDFDLCRDKDVITVTTCACPHVDNSYE